MKGLTRDVVTGIQAAALAAPFDTPRQQRLPGSLITELSGGWAVGVSINR